jgi:predicted ester cyclase
MIAVNKKEFVQEYLKALSGKEKTPALVDQYVADPGLKEHIAFFEAAFPRYEMLVDDLICENDKVVVRARTRAVHKGELMGIPPTGKAIELPFIGIYQIADDKIVKSWLASDQMEVMKQLGVMPEAV